MKIQKIGFITIFMVCLISFTSHAEGLSNDGKMKDNPYGTCNLPPSFKGVDYYDCAIPYNTTCKEIGGYAKGVRAYRTHNYGTMSDPDKKYPGYWANYEGDMATNGIKGRGTVSHDSDGCTIIKIDGIEFYVTAVQPFFYRASTASEFNKICDDHNNSGLGQCIDVILTDGTCIHFLCGDSNSQNHTNGGPMENPLREIQWEFADLKNDVYKNLYACHSGNCLEIWGTDGCSSKFTQKFNMGNGDSDVRIAYYRMYNLKSSDRIEAVSEEAKKSSYKLGSIDTSGSGSDIHVDSKGVAISEENLVGMPDSNILIEGQDNINLAKREDLSIGEQHSIANMSENMEIQSQIKAFDTARRIIMFIGIVIIVYSIIMVMAMVFDSTNNWVDISLVGILSFGRIKYAPNDEEIVDKRKYVSTKKLAISISILFIVGLIILSGSIFSRFSDFAWWLSSKL